MNLCLTKSSPFSRYSYLSPSRQKKADALDESLSNSSRFANAPKIERESLTSNCTPFKPKSFDENDPIYEDVLRLEMFERDIEQKTPKQKVVETENEITDWLGNTVDQKKKPSTAAKGRTERKNKETSFNFLNCAKKNHKICVQNDSEEDEEDDDDVSFLASKYDSQQDETGSHSEGSSGY